MQLQSTLLELHNLTKIEHRTVNTTYKYNQKWNCSLCIATLLFLLTSSSLNIFHFNFHWTKFWMAIHLPPCYNFFGFVPQYRLVQKLRYFISPYNTFCSRNFKCNIERYNMGQVWPLELGCPWLNLVENLNTCNCLWQRTLCLNFENLG